MQKGVLQKFVFASGWVAFVIVIFFYFTQVRLSRMKISEASQSSKRLEAEILVISKSNEILSSFCGTSSRFDPAAIDSLFKEMLKHEDVSKLASDAKARATRARRILIEHSEEIRVEAAEGMSWRGLVFAVLSKINEERRREDVRYALEDNWGPEPKLEN